MTRPARLFIPLAALTIALLVQGCLAVAVGGAAAAGGASAVVYSRGWYRGVTPYPHYQVDRAVRRVCVRARFIERERTCDGSSSNYRYQDLHDVKVRIKLRAVTPDSTRVYIRVGTFGDRLSSQELFQALEDELSATAK